MIYNYQEALSTMPCQIEPGNFKGLFARGIACAIFSQEKLKCHCPMRGGGQSLKLTNKNIRIDHDLKKEGALTLNKNEQVLGAIKNF
jgi:hypothetical protein